MEAFKNLLFLLLFGFLIWFFSQFVAWYWATGIALLIVGYFFPNANSKSKKKSKTVTAKSFIEEGKIYSEQEAVDTLTEFFKALGFNDYKESAELFPSLLRNLKQTYKEKKRYWEKEKISHKEYYTKEVEKLERLLAEEEEEEEVYKEDIKTIKEDMELEIKKCQKCINWYDKQMSSLEDDLSPVMKKIMNESKREGPLSDMEMEHLLEKDLPDSYY